MAEAIVGKWGKNLAVRLPREIVDNVHLREGARVEITAQEDCVVIRRAAPRYTIGQLFRGKTPQEWRELYADTFDWGPDVGREIVEE